MALFDRLRSYFTGESPEEYTNESQEEDISESPEEDGDKTDDNPDGFDSDDDNPDGFGSDDDNPDGYGEEYVDPRSIDEDDALNEQKEDDKKEKKKKQKGEEEVYSKGGKKQALNTVEMNALASRLKCGRRTRKVCPFCKQQSIYPEPMGSKLIRNGLYLAVGANRKERFVCLNKNCKAFFDNGPSARFVESLMGGNLHASHIIQTPTNPFSLKPKK